MFMDFSYFHLLVLTVFVFCSIFYGNHSLGFFLIFLLYTYSCSSSVDYLDFPSYSVCFSLFLGFMYLPIASMSSLEPLDKKFLMFTVLLGSLILINSESLVLVYLGLELQTFSLFVLVSGSSNSVNSSEGGLKYFILGAMSSGMFLLSLSVMYSSTNSLLLGSMSYLNENSYDYMWKFIFLLSVFFNLSLFPLHFWIPDIYEASSNNVMVLLGSLPNFSVLGFILQFNLFSNIMMWCALGSILVGTIGGLNQSKINSLIAYSGIAHMGYGLLTFGLFVNLGILPTLLYMIVYMAGFIPLVMLMDYGTNKEISYISELSGFQNINVILCLSWSLLLLSMGGLPPLSGFLANWWVIWTIVLSNYGAVALLSILIAAIGLGYYLSIVKISYFQSSSSYLIWNSSFSVSTHSTWSELYLGLGLYLVCFLILNPNPILLTVNYAMISFF